MTGAGRRRLRRALIALLLWAPLAVAQIAAAQPPPPTATVDAFYRALHDGDRARVLALLAPDVMIYEQGFADNGRDAYAGAHLADAMAFARSVQRTVTRRASWQSGDAAWVLSETVQQGSFHNAKVNWIGTETVVLRRDGDHWQIAHIHWSEHGAQ